MGKATNAPSFPGRVFCDTSFFYACLDSRDVNHQAARKAAEAAANSRSMLFCTWDIVSETATLLRYRANFGAARRFLIEVKPGLKIVIPDDDAREHAVKLFLKHGEALKLSMCDAISFVVVKEMLNSIPCLTFDADFRKLGLEIWTT